MSKTKGPQNDISSNPDARLNIKKTGDENERSGTSLLKKSELSAIFIGAGLITLIVFFVFFKSTGQKSKDPAVAPVDVQSIEERMVALEKRINLQNPQDGTHAPLDTYTARVERVEAALSVKFDLVTDRLSTLEKGIAGLENKLNKKLEQSTQAKPVPPVKKVAKKPAPVKKALAKVATQTAVHHTVKKGDTLYSISRRYSTSVNNLRALNKLGATAEIFPGDKLVVK
ncbi:MAG: LysM peptidoglycan-binding domain-containing protein [Desulfobacterium sp.]|nr:LysM peptidoglycan-binding domain-containing protein [Desulfobacterium sp.]